MKGYNYQTENVLNSALIRVLSSFLVMCLERIASKIRSKFSRCLFSLKTQKWHISLYLYCRSAIPYVARIQNGIPCTSHSHSGSENALTASSVASILKAARPKDATERCATNMRLARWLHSSAAGEERLFSLLISSSSRMSVCHPSSRTAGNFLARNKTDLTSVLLLYYSALRKLIFFDRVHSLGVFSAENTPLGCTD